MGAEALADRGRAARRDRRAPPARQRPEGGELTTQEARIARLASDGLSNAEIGRACSSARARSSTT